MSERKHISRGGRREIDNFLQRAASVPAPSAARGRLVFALDATASRQPAWDRACALQGQMFDVAAGLGGLAIQLCYYRGFDEFETLPWATRAAVLSARMRSVTCRSGHTQLERVLRHTAREAAEHPLGALVFVGDCLEEDGARVQSAAGALALRGVRAFMFQEGDQPGVQPVFESVARLTRGAYARFDARSADTLRELLRAAAVYATGGARALRLHGERAGGAAAALTHQIDRD